MNVVKTHLFEYSDIYWKVRGAYWVWFVLSTVMMVVIFPVGCGMMVFFGLRAFLAKKQWNNNQVLRRMDEANEIARAKAAK